MGWKFTPVPKLGDLILFLLNVVMSISNLVKIRIGITHVMCTYAKLLSLSKMGLSTLDA